MSTFRGLLEVAGDPESSVVADVDVAQGRIKMSAGGTDLGDWSLNDIRIEPGEDFFRIEADNEVLLLRVRDAKRFASTVGVGVPESEPGNLEALASKRPAPATPPPLTLEPTVEERAEDSEANADKSAQPAGPDEAPLDRRLTFALAAATVLLFVGALLSWGPWRLVQGRVPVARVVTGVAGLAALASTYLGFAGEKRRDVAVVAMLSALIAWVIVIMYAAKAGIGIGYLLTIVATVGVTGVSVIALTRFGAAPPEDDADE